MGIGLAIGLRSGALPLQGQGRPTAALHPRGEGGHKGTKVRTVSFHGPALRTMDAGRPVPIFHPS